MKIQTYSLSEETVSELSLLTAKKLKEDNIESHDAELLHSAVEQVLKKWLETLGEGSECSFYAGKKLGRQYITLSAAGQRVNPFGKGGDCVLSGGNSVQTLLANLGLAPSYHYVNGENQITIMPRRRKLNPLIYLSIALVFGVIVGLSCHALPDEIRYVFSEVIIGPIFDTFIGVLIAVALPMMFLSLVWGIYSIGDTATLGHVGKNVIGRYLGRIFFTLIVCSLVAVPFFNVNLFGGLEGSGEFVSIWNLLLGIIPQNLLTPFTEGNTLQIIFIAVVFGLAMLVLNKKVPVVVQLVGQVNNLIQLIMEWITAILPVIVFISVLNLMLRDIITDAPQFIILFVILILSILANFVLMFSETSIFQKISPKVLLKKIAPTLLIAISTASSAATFSTNMDCCEKKLGIVKKLVNFGVPLGTAFSRPGHAVTFFCMCLYMADYYGISISLSWIVTAIITCGLFAIALPPVPGGGIACYSILFLQLGIPVEALAIAVVLEIILDFIATALNMVAVPLDLTRVAGKLEMVDTSVLRSDKQE